MGKERWCEWHHECREDVNKDSWTCLAHLAEGRALRCNYSGMEDAKNRKYPCMDAEAPKEKCQDG